jgi:hypothetical protein
MGKSEKLDFFLQKSNGFLKASDALAAGISRTYFSEYVRERGLMRDAHVLYKSQNAWKDGMYIIHARYPFPWLCFPMRRPYIC